MSLEDRRYAAVSAFADKPITMEIVGFVGSYIRDQAKVASSFEYVFSSQGGKSDAIDDLLARIAWSSGVLLERLKLKKSTVSDVELRRADICGAYIEAGQLLRVTIEDVVATRWALDCEVYDSNVRRVRFVDSTINLKGGSFSLEDAYFSACTASISGEMLSGQPINFERSKVVLRTRARVSILRISGGLVEFGNGFTVLSGKFDVEDSVIVQRNPAPWYSGAARVRMTRSVLWGLFVEASQLLAWVDGDTVESRAGIAISDCRGVIVTTDVDGKLLKPEFVARFAQTFPEIRIAERGCVKRGVAARLAASHRKVDGNPASQSTKALGVVDAGLDAEGVRTLEAVEHMALKLGQDAEGIISWARAP